MAKNSMPKQYESTNKKYDPLNDGVPKRPMGLFIGIGALAVIGLIVGIIVASNNNDGGSNEAVDFRPVNLTGEALPPLPDGTNIIAESAADPAFGKMMPTATGKTFTGQDIEIKPTGNPQLIFFVAHWCPHCQDEIPRVVEYIDDGIIPDNFDLSAISTSVKASSGNYPPASWLKREEWPNPVMADDASDSAFSYFGGGGFPYLIAVNGDGIVQMRSSGELSKAQFERMIAAAQTETAESVDPGTEDPGTTTPTSVEPTPGSS